MRHIVRPVILASVLVTAAQIAVAGDIFSCPESGGRGQYIEINAAQKKVLIKDFKTPCKITFENGITAVSDIADGNGGGAYNGTACAVFGLQESPLQEHVEIKANIVTVGVSNSQGTTQQSLDMNSGLYSDDGGNIIAECRRLHS